MGRCPRASPGPSPAASSPRPALAPGNGRTAAAPPAREQRLMEAEVGGPGWEETLSSGRDRMRTDQSSGFMSRRGISRNEPGVGSGLALGSQDPWPQGAGRRGSGQVPAEDTCRVQMLTILTVPGAGLSRPRQVGKPSCLHPSLSPTPSLASTAVLTSVLLPPGYSLPEPPALPHLQAPAPHRASARPGLQQMSPPTRPACSSSPADWTGGPAGFSMRVSGTLCSLPMWVRPGRKPRLSQGPVQPDQFLLCDSGGPLRLWVRDPLHPMFPQPFWARCLPHFTAGETEARGQEATPLLSSSPAGATHQCFRGRILIKAVCNYLTASPLNKTRGTFNIFALFKNFITACRRGREGSSQGRPIRLALNSGEVQGRQLADRDTWQPLRLPSWGPHPI